MYFRITSRSRPGMRHELYITRNGDFKGEVTCTCEAAKFSRKRRRTHILDGGTGCWHQERLHEAIAWAVALDEDGGDDCRDVDDGRAA